ncbi:hypothetical protein COT72_04915 [archaeon CG10_big_fil_rev_8_21_14_0_10_43_11]|nr:MAG: hypothetical protein COT72_04915 [archaeon CG10_big_fil_rev_8_21_14_0_10_43_11]
MKFKNVLFKKVTIPNGESVECVLKTSAGTTRAVAPYGTSAGAHEVSSFSKKGLASAIKAFPKLEGREFDSLRALETELLKHDSERFEKIGGNLVLSLSVAFLRAHAKEKGKELFELFRERKVPNPLSKVVGGGVHAPRGSDFQEFLVHSKKPFEEARALNLEFHKLVRDYFNAKQLDFEGGWVVDADEQNVLDALVSIRDGSYPEVSIGLDIAANSFYKKGVYAYKNTVRSRDEQFDFVSRLIKEYALFYVEDPFFEEDFDLFAKLQKKHPQTLICADDLVVTNPDRLKRALAKKACTAAIVKPNQIGLVSRMFEFVRDCKKRGVEPVFSHRSKESYDPFLADFALGTRMMKIGIVGRERNAKLDRLQMIRKKVRA